MSERKRERKPPKRKPGTDNKYIFDKYGLGCRGSVLNCSR